MTTMRIALLLSFALALPLTAGGVEELAWMSGHWSSSADGVMAEEIWTTPAGGTLLGMHRDVKNGRTMFEFIRIAETKEGVVYFAQPSGKTATPFRLTESKPNRAVFTNPEHDFPKRIIYTREGDRLCASVDAGGDDSDAQTWCWTRRE